MENKKENITLDTKIQYLKGVGPKMAMRLNKLGINTIIDLINYFPRDWQDYSHTNYISSLRIGDFGIIKAKIISISNNRSFRKRMFRFRQ